MRLYSAHLKPEAEPVLVREGFCWGALVLGPIWLATRRSWIAAAFSLAAYVLILSLTGGWVRLVLVGALAYLLGLIGHDLESWSMEQRGYLMVHMLAARDADEALQRLLTHRPDLTSRFMPAELR